jgi:hypothetical protein
MGLQVFWYRTPVVITVTVMGLVQVGYGQFKAVDVQVLHGALPQWWPKLYTHLYTLERGN